MARHSGFRCLPRPHNRRQAHAIRTDTASGERALAEPACVGTEREVAKSGGADADCVHPGVRWRLHAHACRQRQGAHALGAIVDAPNWNCDIDIEQCPHCGGQLKLIAAIEKPVVIKCILTLGLAAQVPPRAPARRVDLLQAA